MSKQRKDSAADVDEVVAPEVPAPDPLWPTGAVPEHIPPSQRAEALVKVQYEGVDNFTCQRCGTHLNQSSGDPGLCAACFKLEASNHTVAKRTNANWMEIAQECGLALHERQPEESDLEWLIWDKYRAHYPMKLPTWRELAEECHVSVAKVVATSQKWSFRVRMQAWARYTDDGLSESRIKAIKDMNDRQVGMAVVLQDKLQAAIAKLDPALLKPSEIVSLLKASTELERRIKEAMPQKVEGTVAEAMQQQKTLTKTEDLAEVMAILAKTGMLPTGGGGTLAVEQTTTTRLVAAPTPIAGDIAATPEPQEVIDVETI